MRNIPAAPDHDIELSGGALALDFANTVGGTHVSPTHDHLRSYGDIVRFAGLAGGLDASTAKRLVHRAEREPARAAAVYELGISLRESIWGVFSALASGEVPGDEDLELIGDAAASGAARSRLVYDRDGFGWSFASDGDELEDASPLAAHEIDVERTNPDRGKLAELLDVLVDLAGHAEAVDGLVIDERRVRRTRLGVMLVVVPGTVSHVRGEIGREALLAV